MISTNTIWAQIRPIQGRVLAAETNEQLPGASVLIKGQSTGTATGVNGEFSLNTEKVSLKKLNVEFRRDLVHSDIFICTLDVLKAFK